MKKISFILLIISLIFISILNLWYANWTSSANTRIDNSESTTLRLSDDIWKMADRIWEMADRIWVMADRILTMADKILKTQEIQSKNLETTQSNILKTLNLIDKSISSNNQMLKALIDSNNKVSSCMCKWK